jgi:hypothetical protein
MAWYAQLATNQSNSSITCVFAIKIANGNNLLPLYCNVTSKIGNIVRNGELLIPHLYIKGVLYVERSNLLFDILVLFDIMGYCDI